MKDKPLSEKQERFGGKSLYWGKDVAKAMKDLKKMLPEWGTVCHHNEDPCQECKRFWNKFNEIIGDFK